MLVWSFDRTDRIYRIHWTGLNFSQKSKQPTDGASLENPCLSLRCLHKAVVEVPVITMASQGFLSTALIRQMPWRTPLISSTENHFHAPFHKPGWPAFLAVRFDRAGSFLGRFVGGWPELEAKSLEPVLSSVPSACLFPALWLSNTFVLPEASFSWTRSNRSCACFSFDAETDLSVCSSSVDTLMTTRSCLWPASVKVPGSGSKLGDGISTYMFPFSLIFGLETVVMLFGELSMIKKKIILTDRAELLFLWEIPSDRPSLFRNCALSRVFAG